MDYLSISNTIKALGLWDEILKRNCCTRSCLITLCQRLLNNFTFFGCIHGPLSLKKLLMLIPSELQKLSWTFDKFLFEAIWDRCMRLEVLGNCTEFTCWRNKDQFSWARFHSGGFVFPFTPKHRKTMRQTQFWFLYFLGIDIFNNNSI